MNSSLKARLKLLTKLDLLRLHTRSFPFSELVFPFFTDLLKNIDNFFRNLHIVATAEQIQRQRHEIVVHKTTISSEYAHE